MALTFKELTYTLFIELFFCAVFILAYSLLCGQKVNARIFFVRWFIKDEEGSRERFEGEGDKASPAQRRHAWNWVYEAVAFEEDALLDHAGLDMVLYLRMLQLGWKVFIPIAIVSFVALIPLYLYQGNLSSISSAVVPSLVDEMTLGNMVHGSGWLWLPSALCYVYTAWILVVMGFEFRSAALLKEKFSGTQRDDPSQFTVLVQQIPVEDPLKIPEETEKYFKDLYPDDYFLTQGCYNVKDLASTKARLEYKENMLEACRIRMQTKGVRPTTRRGLCGPEVDAIDSIEDDIKRLKEEVRAGQAKVVADPDAVLPTCFVSFRSRRTTVVAAQTPQNADPSKWATTWAPGPGEVVWANLPFTSVQRGVCHMWTTFVVFLLLIGYTIPVSIIQGIANLSVIEHYAPWLTPVLETPLIKSAIEGFLPGLALILIFLILPPILKALCRQEGHVDQSDIEQEASRKYYLFRVFIVFFANLLVGSAIFLAFVFIEDPQGFFQWLGSAVAANSTFFMTFTMISGWVVTSFELIRLDALFFFHLKNLVLVVTSKDRIKAMSNPSPEYVTLIPETGLFFLLSFMYMLIAPFYLPFVLLYFFWAYIVYKNQFLNVYSPTSNWKGGFWPQFHMRAVTSLVLAQIVLFVVLGLKGGFGPSILLVPLPFLTVAVNHYFISQKYSPAFSNASIQEAIRLDKEDAGRPGFDLYSILHGAYRHPALQDIQEQHEAGEGQHQADGGQHEADGASRRTVMAMEGGAEAGGAGTEIVADGEERRGGRATGGGEAGSSSSRVQLVKVGDDGGSGAGVPGA